MVARDAIYFVDDTRGTFAKVPAEGGTPERMFTLQTRSSSKSTTCFRTDRARSRKCSAA